MYTTQAIAVSNTTIAIMIVVVVVIVFFFIILQVSEQTVLPLKTPDSHAKDSDNSSMYHGYRLHGRVSQ